MKRQRQHLLIETTPHKFLSNPTVISKRHLNLSASHACKVLFSLYCLCQTHSDCQWRIWVDLTKLQSNFQSDDVINSGFIGYIARLSITDCTDVGIRAFFSLPRRIFSRLSTLQVHIRVNEKSTGLALQKH